MLATSAEIRAGAAGLTGVSAIALAPTSATPVVNHGLSAASMSYSRPRRKLTILTVNPGVSQQGHFGGLGRCRIERVKTQLGRVKKAQGWPCRPAHRPTVVATSTVCSTADE